MVPRETSERAVTRQSLSSPRRSDAFLSEVRLQALSSSCPLPYCPVVRPRNPCAIACIAFALGTVLALPTPAGAATRMSHSRSVASGTPQEPLASPMRTLPSPLYGVTVDDITNLNDVVASSRALGHMPVTRV